MTDDCTTGVLFLAEAMIFSLIRKSTQALRPTETPIQRGPGNSSHEIKLMEQEANQSPSHPTTPYIFMVWYF
jgi:hypothetical protein